LKKNKLDTVEIAMEIIMDFPQEVEIEMTDKVDSVMEAHHSQELTPNSRESLRFSLVD